ncbi:hypothetical protein VB773_13375 [Haloarculaceae archaeon H-GB2-1]|nr:hypothetical protein [Haloarculaceae archaeon H-GB1-1]MEA5386957.1 hypothetical protein [Haloarculaceae archaeon H-GB11]MEA5408461.1 hypothetical protein [Haloarculaceae archaeon H-GB2-1]
MRDDLTPDLDPGLTVLRTPNARSTALHRLVLATLPTVSGTTYWMDARNTASTYALYDMASSPRRLDGVRIARAFTAYQHHDLVKRTVREATARTGFLVAPNVASLYRDDDLPDHEREGLFAASLRTLAELAGALDVPILASVTGEDELAAAALDRADRELTCERTPFGYRYDGDDFETRAYDCGGYWQTTIPYWVDLFGAVGERSPAVEPTPFSLVEG